MTRSQNQKRMLFRKDRRSSTSIGILLLFVLTMGAAAFADSEPDGLVIALKNKYPVTQTSPDRTQIAQPGIVMQVVKGGINARPWDSMMSFDNLIVDGAVQQRSRWIELTKTTEARLGQGKDLLILQPGEKVYISKIESKTESKDDLLKISVLSCDPRPVDDGASQKRYGATLSFKMPKNSLAESAPDQIEQMVEALLTPEPGGATGNNKAAAAAPPTQPRAAAPASQNKQVTKTAQAMAAPVLTAVAARMVPFGGAIAQLASASHSKTSSTGAPAAAAPSAQAPTQNIALGQTIEQVVASMGQPKQIVDLGTKKIYTYPNLKIVFVNGKVNDVQ
jgi:hypothetical protein